jgi:hypothetical protein
MRATSLHLKAFPSHGNGMNGNCGQSPAQAAPCGMAQGSAHGSPAFQQMIGGALPT